MIQKFVYKFNEFLFIFSGVEPMDLMVLAAENQQLQHDLAAHSLTSVDTERTLKSIKTSLR